MLSGGRALHRPLAGGQVVSEIGCPPGGMEKCVSRGAGDIESGRTASSLEQPAAPRRTRLGDAPRLPAIGTADVHDQGRARNHPRIEPAIPTGLNHETTNPSFGDVGWTMHWFAAWLSRAHPINGLPVLVLRSRPVYCPGSLDGPQAEWWMRIADGLAPLRRRQKHPQRCRAVSLQERRTTTGEAGPPTTLIVSPPVQISQVGANALMMHPNAVTVFSVVWSVGGRET
jgi:hypothetical protein